MRQVKNFISCIFAIGVMVLFNMKAINYKTQNELSYSDWLNHYKKIISLKDKIPSVRIEIRNSSTSNTERSIELTTSDQSDLERSMRLLNLAETTRIFSFDPSPQDGKLVGQEIRIRSDGINLAAFVGEAELSGNNKVALFLQLLSLYSGSNGELDDRN